MKLPRLRPLLALPLLLLLAGGLLIAARPNADQHKLAASTPHAVGFGNLPLLFVPWAAGSDAATFMAHGMGATMLFSAHAVEMSFAAGASADPGTTPEQQPPAMRRLNVSFIGATNATPSGLEQQTGRVSFVQGADSAAWRSDLHPYGSILYHGLYPGVDLAYAGAGGRLKGTYTLAPGADPALIRWHYDGAAGVALDGAGNLAITLADGPQVTEEAPIAWQDANGRRVAVEVRYSLASDGSVGFAPGAYDRTLPLTIDPRLIYSSYVGGMGGDSATKIVLDAAGNIYLAGSLAFPQPNGVGTSDIFVDKFDEDGSHLIYSIYFGGHDQDFSPALALDSSGSAYVAGSTYSLDWPLVHPLQDHNVGVTDAYIAKINAAGTGFVYSTYLGGTGFDSAAAITVDAAGGAVIAGSTDSRDFPTLNAYQPNIAGAKWSDAFVAHLTPDGSALAFSTYLGGGSPDWAVGLAVATNGEITVGGTTDSADFPVVNPYQAQLDQFYDLFIARFSADGRQLLYSTYFGGSGFDQLNAMARDGAGMIYLAGKTSSQQFPLRNPIQPVHGLGFSDGFVTKFDPAQGALVFSTYLGGNNDDMANGIAVGADGAVYVVGETQSFNFPVVAPYQPGYHGGGNDGFAAKLASDGRSLLYATYLGGRLYDTLYGVAADAAGQAYVTGGTSSLDFPVTADAAQPAMTDYSDALLAKLGDCNIDFGDVAADDWFQPYVRYLFCAGVASGYNTTPPCPPNVACFRPDAAITRGQLAKVVVEAFHFTPDTAQGPHFADVPPEGTFYSYIETLAQRNVVGGYSCGGAGEPCDDAQRPYFRAGMAVIRAQVANIVVKAAVQADPLTWQLVQPLTPSFTDVAADDPHFAYIETAAYYAILSGYPCDEVEACLPPLNQPAFRPYNPGTRAQISKMIYLAQLVQRPTPTVIPTAVPTISGPLPTDTAVVAAPKSGK